MKRREPCPIPGCLDDKMQSGIMCRRHWRMTPPPYKIAVNTAWRRIKTSKDASHIQRIAEIRKWFCAKRAAETVVMKIDGLVEVIGNDDA